MKFTMFVRDADQPNQEPWQEPEDRPEVKTAEGCLEWARDCISRFNSSLRPHEHTRALVRVEVIGESDAHTWRKASLMTEAGGYDRMECIVCGVTGKRYGLGANGVRLDPKFKAKKWQRCQPEEG